MFGNLGTTLYGAAGEKGDQESGNIHTEVKTDAFVLRTLGSKDLPLIEVELGPGKKVCSEPGRLVSLPEGVKFKAILGDGSEAGMFSKLVGAASRMFSGESLMLLEVTNHNSAMALVRFGTVIPGNLVVLNLADFGNELIAMNGVYLMGSAGLKIASCFKQKLGAAFFGGESFILQKITGSGVVVLQGGGCVLREELSPSRPCIRVDTGCLVAFTSGLVYNIALAGGLKSMLFGGEGIFHATISLPPGMQRGVVWIESYPYSKFISQIKNMYPHD